MRTISTALLVLGTLGISARAQQGELKQIQNADPKPQTHATATGQKRQIAQPQLRTGKQSSASSLLISLHGCADILLIDPRGRKLGYDADSRKSYLGIPGGIYDEGNPIDDDDDQEPEAKKMVKTQPECIVDKTVQFPNPVSGTYTLNMSGQTRTAFKLDIISYGSDTKVNGHYTLSESAGSASLTYQFQLPPVSDSKSEVKTRPR